MYDFAHPALPQPLAPLPPEARRTPASPLPVTATPPQPPTPPTTPARSGVVIARGLLVLMSRSALNCNANQQHVRLARATTPTPPTKRLLYAGFLFCGYGFLCWTMCRVWFGLFGVRCGGCLCVIRDTYQIWLVWCGYLLVQYDLVGCCFFFFF